MSVSKDRKELYENLPDHLRETVDGAYSVVHAFLLNKGLACAVDDRAENLVGAIARYVKDSEN